MALTLINNEHHKNPSGFNNKIRWIWSKMNYDFNNFEKVYNSVKRNEHWERAFNNVKNTYWENNTDIDNWNIRIIQNGELIQDQLYNIYIPLSVVFDENEGFFKKDDYEETIKENADYRSPLFPARTFHIKEHDYYSVSVNLSTYLKMIKGEKPFPFKCDLNERRKYDLIENSLIRNVPKEIKDLLNYKNLPK